MTSSLTSSYAASAHNTKIIQDKTSSRLLGKQTGFEITSWPFKQNWPTSLTDNINLNHVQKLEDFRNVFSKVVEDPFEGLALVDAVKRLGVDYHYQHEIEEILERQYSMIYTNHYNHDLQEVALRFRLLRQEGYYVPADVFDKFRNKDGKFNQKVKEDIKGLMGLYEASQLRIEGEDVLDDVEDFSVNFLNEYCVTHNHHHQEARLVKNALRYPQHKSLARFMAKSSFLKDFPSENRWINDLQNLAKMDFNAVKYLHQNEIVQVSKWWQDLGLAKELSFARNQPLKWYIWTMAMITDPKLSEERIDLAKPLSLIYIIDDMYDVYGTIDELNLFTKIISRWDLSAIDRLPNYMKTSFKALDLITNEISYKVYKKYGYNPLYSLRNTWSVLCNAFMVEAKWFTFGHLPKSEEYLKNGIASSGVHVVLVHLFFLLGESLTRENIQLIDSNPGIISSTATILRLFDDLGSAKDENQNGKDGSYLHYYMNEHHDSKEDIARKHVINGISDAWKRLNKECLSPYPFSKSLSGASLNLARMVPLMYSYDENQRLPCLEGYIKSLLYEAVPTEGVYN